MIFSEYMFTIVMCLVQVWDVIQGLDINCGTRGIDVGFQEEHRELRCICSERFDQHPEKELFSEIFNPHLGSFSSYIRPLSQKITHIILVNCKAMTIILDLDKVDKYASAITDISFESIENLSLEFRSIVQPKMRFVFTNIVSNQLSGSISGRSSNLEMFFRQFNTADKDKTSVTFMNIDIQANIQLLNFQDIGHVRVVESHFDNIDTLDIFHSTKCHTGLDNRGEEVSCSKDALFYSSRYSSTREVTNPPFYRDRNPRFEKNTPSFYKSPMDETVSNSVSNSMAEYQPKSVASSLLFIVPMVLFFGVTILMLISLVFLRYRQSVHNWRVSLATSDNWFLKPSRSSSPESSLTENRGLSALEEERSSQSSSLSAQKRKDDLVIELQR